MAAKTNKKETVAKWDKVAFWSSTALWSSPVRSVGVRGVDVLWILLEEVSVTWLPVISRN